MPSDYDTRASDGVRTIKHSAIAACPFTILMPAHYRADGHCRCDDPEMADWGYNWNGERWSA